MACLKRPLLRLSDKFCLKACSRPFQLILAVKRAQKSPEVFQAASCNGSEASQGAILRIVVGSSKGMRQAPDQISENVETTNPEIPEAVFSKDGSV